MRINSHQLDVCVLLTVDKGRQLLYQNLLLIELIKNSIIVSDSLLYPKLIKQTPLYSL